MSRAIKSWFEIYTDGSQVQDVSAAGALVLSNQGGFTITQTLANASSNETELYAAVLALENIPKGSRCAIYTDSMFVVLNADKYRRLWEQKHWQLTKGSKLEFRDKWQRLISAANLHKVVLWSWIKGHNGNAKHNKIDETVRALAKEVVQHKNLLGQFKKQPFNQQVLNINTLLNKDILWRSSKGQFYKVLSISNLYADPNRHEYPPTVVYMGLDGKIWSRDATNFLLSKTPVLAIEHVNVLARFDLMAPEKGQILENSFFERGHVMAREDLMIKYRPCDFEGVIGQDHVAEALQGFKDCKKWPHAYLFTGPSGCGKTTFARIVAKEVGCKDENLLEIDAASQSGIEATKSLLEGLKYTGFGDNNIKVIILDECHSLTKASWQALLKPVEEPSEHVYYIFCTTEAEKVPDTIKTRCLTFNLKAVPDESIQVLLEVVAEEEGIVLPEKAIAVIAQASLGSPRRALSHLSKVRSCNNLKSVIEILETADENKEVIDLARLLIQRDGSSWGRILQIIQKLDTQSPESIRMTVVAYVTKVCLSTSNPEKAAHLLNVLDAFSKPFNANDKHAPLLLAIGNLLFKG